MASPPSTVYRDQLASLYHGLALWEPSPFKEIYDRVSIGDVGFVREGAFFRMFNVMLPWDHESNGKLGKPMQYEPLSCGPFPDNSLGKGEYCSQYVSRERNAGTNQAMTPDDAEGITYRCRGPGALLCLPHENHRKNIIHKKAFEDYIRDHVVSWFTWTQNKRLGVDRIEELILVSGCTLATSWAAAAFVDNTMDAEISLASRTIGDNGGASFSWRNMQGPVQHHNSPFDSDPQNPPTTPDQCVFIRGFRAKRILFWTRPLQAAAEPLPDDPDNRSDDEIQVTEVPGVPNYRDPLIGVLDYIVEKCLEDTIAEDTIAIAHDDDLKLIKGVETLTAEAIQKFLREQQMALRVENGVRKLQSIPLEASQSREQLLPSQVVEVDGQLGQGAVPQVVPSPRSKAADHSGKVTRVSEHPVIEGSQLLIYIGEWTSDGERTALGRLRYQTPDSQKRFKEWIEASLGFQHRNILNVAGHVTINDVVYSVNPNPWIENGNIREYLRRNPDADRVRLLSEVASGVEFFHEREILHGDLCGKNILINHDGKAIVCGFGLSEFSNPGVSRARWLAPEQITSASAAAPTEKADIWSFGLLCLEVFTGEDPYHGHSDLYVPVLLSQGTHPEHPGSMAVGLSPKMWDLMQSCWQVDPAQRPSMSEIQSTIRDMLLRRDVMTIEQPFQPFQPFCIYQEQLSSIYHGRALWKPNPQGLYKQVSIGDVGYVNNEGAFIRLFNVTLPSDDESNKKLGDPFYYDPLSPDSFTICSETFSKSDHYSRGVSREDNAHNMLAMTPDQAEGVTYECGGRGALLSLPCGGLRQAVIQTKIFEEYAGKHVADWFRWSKVRGLPIERTEDLVLIHGCTLVTSWAAAAFDVFKLDKVAQVSLASRTLKNGGASFVWSNICGTVERHDSQLESLDERISSAPLNQCVFIKCTRAKPNKFWAKIFRAPAPAFNLPGAALFSSAGVAYDARTLTESISQTTPDTPPGKNSDSSLPRRSSGSNSSLHLGSPPVKPPSSRTRTTSPKRNSSMAPRQPTRAAALFIDLPQGRNREPVNPVVLGSMETAACDSERLLRHATDGTVSAGNLEGLVSRVITDIEDPSRDDRIRETFLTIYQLFATSERLFHILKRRFESSELDPVATSSRFSILLFIESWLKKGFADEDLKCTSMIKQLVLPLVDSETISEKMEAKAKEIARLIDDPDYVLLRQPKNCTALRSEDAERPQGVTPTDLAAALTVVEGDRFKCITYWDYVNFTRWQPNVQRIEVFNIVHDLVKVWVQRTVLKSDFLEERMGMYEEWIYTAKECRALNNFSSTSAIVLGLMSPLVSALVLTCESKAKSDLYALAKELTPTDGVYQNTLEKVATRDLIPWLDRHLSTLNSSFADSIPIVEVDGHPLIDFKQCSNIAEQIDTLVQYSPPRTHHTTRPDLLAYVEYSLKCSRSNAVLRNAEERSARLAEEERVFYAQRKKMTGLGFAWSPPRRRK